MENINKQEIYTRFKSFGLSVFNSYEYPYIILATITTIIYFPIGLAVPLYMLYKANVNDVSKQTGLQKLLTVILPVLGIIVASYFSQKKQIIIGIIYTIAIITIVSTRLIIYL